MSDEMLFAEQARLAHLINPEYKSKGVGQVNPDYLFDYVLWCWINRDALAAARARRASGEKKAE